MSDFFFFIHVFDCFLIEVVFFERPQGHRHWVSTWQRSRDLSLMIHKNRDQQDLKEFEKKQKWKWTGWMIYDDISIYNICFVLYLSYLSWIIFSNYFYSPTIRLSSLSISSNLFQEAAVWSLHGSLAPVRFRHHLDLMANGGWAAPGVFPVQRSKWIKMIGTCLEV